MALLVAPAAILTLMLAYSLFGSALSNLQTTQTAAAIGRAATVRAWLDAAGRSLANESGAGMLLTRDRCAQLAQAFLKNNPGFSSIRLFDQEDEPCESGKAFVGNKPAWSGLDSNSGYRLTTMDGRLWIVAGAPNAASALIVEEAAMRERLHLEVDVGETHIALIGEGGETLAQDSSGLDESWRPNTLDLASSRSTFRSPDRNGVTAAYALSTIGSGLQVLLRFDDRLYEAAWRRFLILCLAQLTVLGLLAYVYAVAIRRDVVRWIEGIDLAARLRGGDPESRAIAPVSAKMPRELRNVAESFNAMADHAAERREALETSLAENRALMLEMHHRIKNSLQVIQSYLALIRRNGPRAEAPMLARIEARVGVLAVAYRLALTPKGIRPIKVKPFLEEVFAAATGGLKQPRQRATCEVAWDGELIVDRAIPLGLALAEALVASLDAPDVFFVGARLTPDADGGVEIVIEADAAPTGPGLPEKVMRGLAAQLGATQLPPAPGVMLHWRFVP
jgi:signal transduction histidine kinase